MFAPITEAKAESTTSQEYKVEGSYEINIPATVTVTDKESGNLGVTGTVQPYHKLNVGISSENSDKYTLKCGSHQVNYTISADGLINEADGTKQFTYSADTEATNFSKNITVTATDTSDATVSGEYTDILTFTLECQPTKLFTLNYDPNGGTMEESSKQLAYGQVYGELPKPSKQNCTFKGWYREKEFYTQNQVTSTSRMEDADTTIYAHWTGTWNVDINANGGKLYVKDSSIIAGASEENPIYSPNPTFKVIYHDGAYNNLLISAEKEGYTCTGFFDAPSGGDQVWDVTGPCIKSGKYYEDLNGPKGAVWVNNSVEQGQKFTFYPQWKANNYTVTYDKNASDATGETTPSLYTYDESENLNTNGFSREGYTFIGWSKDKNATTAEYTDKQSVKNLTSENNGNVTLYAVWKENTSSNKSTNDVNVQPVQNKTEAKTGAETQENNADE